MAIKSLSIRIDDEMLDKLHYVADYEARSANGQIIVLIRECIEKFEEKHGKSCSAMSRVTLIRARTDPYNPRKDKVNTRQINSECKFMFLFPKDDTKKQPLAAA